MTKGVMKGRLLLHAPNIHIGGGLTLFKTLLKKVPDRTCLLVDERLPIADDELLNFEVYRIKPSLWHRFAAEILLKKLAGKYDKVLCFGNLPPLFQLRAQVTLFIQNRCLVEPELIKSIPMKLRLRLLIERFWLRYFQQNANKVMVQTPSMKVLACDCLSASVTLAPFVASPEVLLHKTKVDEESKKYDFIYVASGDPHKNHRNLLEAWVRLAKEGVFPTLCLTIDKDSFPELTELIAKYKIQYKICIENVGVIEYSDVLRLYEKAGTLIFPSILESFGLPLIEAKAAGLKIVASELDYVRDLFDPDESFDPLSVTSIARALKRSMNIKDEKCHLLSADEFLSIVREA